MDKSFLTNHNVNWASFYKIGGIAALIALVYSLTTLIIFMVLGMPPETAQEGFTMLAENRLAGLLRMDVLTILVMLPLYLVWFPLLARDFFRLAKNGRV